MDTSLSSDERAELLLPEMTLQEKAELMAGDPYPPGQELAYINYAIPRLGIPRASDGRYRAVGASALDPTTAFPMGLAAAATWNLEVEREVGAAVREEARLKQYNMVLGPNVDIPRSPWWSRVGESFGEDALLAGRLAAAFVEGAQAEKDLGVNLKHYNVYSQETNRRGAQLGGGGSEALNQNMIVDERTLQEFYTRPWCHRSQGSRVGHVLVQQGQRHLRVRERAPIEDILRGQLGFEGFVLTDFGASRHTRRRPRSRAARTWRRGSTSRTANSAGRSCRRSTRAGSARRSSTSACARSCARISSSACSTSRCRPHRRKFRSTSTAHSPARSRSRR